MQEKTVVVQNWCESIAKPLFEGGRMPSMHSGIQFDMLANAPPLSLYLLIDALNECTPACNRLRVGFRLGGKVDVSEKGVWRRILSGCGGSSKCNDTLNNKYSKKGSGFSMRRWSPTPPETIESNDETEYAEKEKAIEARLEDEDSDYQNS